MNQTVFMRREVFKSVTFSSAERIPDYLMTALTYSTTIADMAVWGASILRPLSIFLLYSLCFALLHKILGIFIIFDYSCIVSVTNCPQFMLSFFSA